MSSSGQVASSSEGGSEWNQNLIDAFRNQYRAHHNSVQEILREDVDSFRLVQIGDDLDEFSRIIEEYGTVLDDSELHILRSNVVLMQQDVRLRYEAALEASHDGRPSLVQTVRTGRPGRPRKVINSDFLRWAVEHRSTSGIAKFLNVSRSTTRSALLSEGIRSPGRAPFPIVDHTSTMYDSTGNSMSERTAFSGNEPGYAEQHDELLDPTLPMPLVLPADLDQPSVAGHLANINDDELDKLIIRLRVSFKRAGIRMLDGLLRRLGCPVPRERIRQSLIRVDPLHRIFGRIQLRRRGYTVPGPNALWHHDGQHGLIRWGIVIHGFIDGYSRLITGLQANNNNRAETVLNLFLRSAQVYGVPSRLRGDHGGENVLVAAQMESFNGTRRGSYIWGRSVHNVRIERLWADVTIQVGTAWYENFTALELRYGLDINSRNHIWLLQYLFLGLINSQMAQFAEAWNVHKLRIQDGPDRSPEDMYGFDMLVHGIRGQQLDLSDEELEVYGVDWDGLHNEALLQSQRQNNPPSEAGTSWLRQTGPPPNLKHVVVEPPPEIFDTDCLVSLHEAVHSWIGSENDTDIIAAWIHGLAHARLQYPDDF